MSSDQYSTAPSAYGLPPKEKTAAGGEPKIEYFAAYNYVFEHPEWMMSMLLGSVCMLIPVLNSIIIFGYRYEIVEMRVRFPQLLYPKFDFGRFAQYLTRGVWPFLIDFILQFIVQIPLFILIYGSMVAVVLIAQANEQVGIILLVVVIPLLIIALLVGLTLVYTALIPLYLRAGLSQDFALAFNFRWIKDFLAKVGMQALLLNLFLVATGFFLVLLGYATCGIGLIPISFFIMGPVLAHAHYQLYRLYLARGGEPIPLKPLQIEPAYTSPQSTVPPGSSFPPPGKPIG